MYKKTRKIKMTQCQKIHQHDFFREILKDVQDNYGFVNR